MITKNKIKTYIKLDGDIDMYLRLNVKHQNLSDEEWNLISRLYTRLIISKSNKCSKEFADETKKELTENFDKEAITLFMKIIDKDLSYK